MEQSGLTDEELLRQQEELFERARLRMNSTSNGGANESNESSASNEAEA